MAGSYDGDVTAAPPQYIISLEDARTAVGMQAGNDTKDADLQTFIAAATPIIEDLVGPIMSRARVESYDGGSASIALLFAPVLSVTSVIESYGTVDYTLTLQDIFAGTGLNAFGYTVDLASGVVTRRASGVATGFAPGRRNIQVSYTSGRTTVTANITLATRLLVRHLWLISGQQGFRPSMGSPDQSMTKTPSGFAVPNAVVEMCGGADTRPPGMA